MATALLRATLGLSMVAQPVSIYRLTHPRVPAGVMTPPSSSRLACQSPFGRLCRSTLQHRPSLQSATARRRPHGGERLRQAARYWTLSAAGASTANMSRASGQTGRAPGRLAH